MTRSVTHALVGLAGAAALVLGMGACSSGSSDQSAAGAAATSIEEATPTATEETTPAATEEPSADDSSAALDEVVRDASAGTDSIKDQLGDTYSDLTVTGEAPGTLVYSYYFAEPIGDLEAGAAGIETQSDTLKDMAQNQVFPMMEQYGVADPQMRFVYYDADGSTVIWEHTYSESD